MKPLVSAIIVNYNGGENVLSCIQAFLKQSYKPLQIIVSDNGSTDDSVQKIKKQFPKVHIIENKKNIGFGNAVNSGFTRAKGKYVMLYNDDIFVKKDAIQKLVEVMEKDITVGLTQSKLLSFTNPSVVQSARSFLTWTGFATGQGAFKDTNDTALQYTFSAGAPMVRATLFKKLHGFDRDYFLYFEETDFAWRSWLVGYKAVYVPSSKVLHKGGVTTKKLPSEIVVYNAFRNRLDSLIKNTAFLTLCLMLPVHLLLLLGGIFLLLVVGKWRHSRAIAGAILFTIFHLQHILQKRKQMQFMRVLTDREVFSYVMGPTLFSYFYTITKKYINDVYLYEGR